MTRTRKALIVVLSVLCLVCMGLFTLTACSKKTLQSIKVTTQPTKIEYIDGEKFDKTGMVVTATYSDNSEKVLEDSEWDYDFKDALKVPDGKFETSQTIKISYTEKEETKTANTSVKVTNYITEATVTSQPTTLEYYIGQYFNVSGMKINAKYQNGTTKEIEVTSQNSKVAPDGALGKNDTQITVTIGGYDVKVNVTILNALYVEAETGYRNGGTIELSTGDQGNLRTDAKTEDAQGYAKSLYEAHLKAQFAVEKLSEGEGFDAEALAKQVATPEDLSSAFGGTAAVYNSSVTAGGEIISKLYVETVKWLKAEANKEAIEAYVASEDYEALVDAYIAGENEDKTEWNYEKDVAKYTAHAGSDKNEYYLGQNNQGDIVSFLFESSKATTGSINFRLANAYLYVDNGSWGPIVMGDIQFNKLCEFYVNGVKQEIPADRILYGGKTEDGSNNKALWVNWDEVSFNNVAFVEGRNVIELKFLNHGIAAQEGYSFAANIDTLIVAPSQDASGKDTSDLDTYPNDAKATANATSVTLSAEGVVTITGTYTGVAGYVGDILGISVGDVSANVTTDMAAGTFTATVDASEFELGDYVLSVNGANATVPTETVRVGAYNDYKFVVENNKITLNIDSIYKVNVTSATIETPAITLENRDGKACLVIAGGTYEATIENFTEEEALPRIAAAIAKLYYSDLQNNPNEGGASGWGMVVTNTHFVNILPDNKFEVVIDLTGLKLTTMTMHFVHANEDGTFPTGGGSDFKPDIAAFEANLELVIGETKYEVIYDKTTYFGCVGVKVSEANALKLEPNSIEFKVEDNKVYYVVNITFENYKTEADVRAAVTQLDFQGDPLVVFKDDDLANITTVDMTAGTMTIKADITDLPIAEYYWTHIFINGKSNDLAINYDKVTPVECNGKLYANAFVQFSWGTRYLLVISDPTAPVKVTIGQVSNDQTGFEAIGRWTYGIMSKAAEAGAKVGTHEIVGDTLTIGFEKISNDVNTRFYYMSDQPAGTKIKITATAKLNVDGALKLSLAVTDTIDLTADTEKEITIDYTVGDAKGNGPIRFHFEVAEEADRANVVLVLSNLKIEVVTDTPVEGGEETPAE